MPADGAGAEFLGRPVDESPADPVAPRGAPRRSSIRPAPGPSGTGAVPAFRASPSGRRLRAPGRRARRPAAALAAALADDGTPTTARCSAWCSAAGAGNWRGWATARWWPTCSTPATAVHRRTSAPTTSSTSPTTCSVHMPGWTPELARLEARLLETCDAVIATSEPTRAALQEQSPLPVHCVPNGVDGELFLAADAAHGRRCPARHSAAPGWLRRVAEPEGATCH